jgi:uncharacterized protein (TIGR00297 family)
LNKDLLLSRQQKEMDPFGPRAVAVALSVASLLAVRARRRQTLTASGAAAGFVVGFCLVATGLRGMVLVFFYQLGSWATKYKKHAKALVDESVEGHSVRGARQVLAVSAAATVLSLYHALLYGRERPISFLHHPGPSKLACAVLAHHCTSLADTWASELGMVLSAGAGAGRSAGLSPVLITRPWRRVPVGTNGGITFAGTVCSLAGGLVIAALTLAMDAVCGTEIVQPLRILAYGAVCGILGSVLDSVLGATVQITYFDDRSKRVVSSLSVAPNAKHVSGLDLLTNEQVNLVSTIITTAFGGWLLAPWMLT